MKYIIIDHASPVIFTDALTHRDVGRLGRVTSAGFVSFMADPVDEDVKVVCSGRSVSLNIDSRGEEDATIIKRAIRGY